MKRFLGRSRPASPAYDDGRSPARGAQAPHAVAWSNVIGDLHGEDIRNALALLGMVIVLGLSLVAGGWLFDVYVLR